MYLVLLHLLEAREQEHDSIPYHNFIELVSLQETTGHEPDVYRFLPRDVLIYRVAMGMAVFGSATALIYVFKLATGDLPAKRD